jgi:TRAP-type C4-dicarboxylate transport system permease small subunit
MSDSQPPRPKPDTQGESSVKKAVPHTPRSSRPRGGLGGALSLFDRALEKFEAFILAYGIILMAINVVANVIGRQVIGQSIYFSEELNQFLIVLVTFVGLGYAARRGRHIRMSAVYDNLGDSTKKALMILISACTAAVMFLLAWYAYQYVANVAEGGRVTAALRLPLYVTYLWVPLGFFITGIQYSLTVVRNLISPEVWISFSEQDVYDEEDPTVGSGT